MDKFETAFSPQYLSDGFSIEMKVRSLSRFIFRSPHPPSHAPDLPDPRGPWIPQVAPNSRQTPSSQCENVRSIRQLGQRTPVFPPRGQSDGIPSDGFGGILYSTAPLTITISTNTGRNTGSPFQLSPNPGVTSFAQQTQSPSSPTPAVYISASVTTC